MLPSVLRLHVKLSAGDSMQAPIEELYESLKDQELRILREIEIADLQALQRVWVKYLILAASSYFEAEIKAHITEFVSHVSNKNASVLKIIKKQLLARHYHTIIDWKEETKLSSFCNFFSIDINKCADSEVRIRLEAEFTEFLNLGILRNDLIHKDLITFNVELTIEDVYKKYKSANGFVRYFPKMLESTRE